MREARRIFAQLGAGVALEAVADAAGVGIATLYRNFDSRLALLDAVAAAVLDDVTAATEQAREALSTHDGDAWTVWSAWAEQLADMELGALASALAGEYGSGLSDEVSARQRRLEVALEGLFELACAEGLVLAEVTPLELVVGIGRVTRPQAVGVAVMDVDLGRRLVSVLLQGLRVPAEPTQPITRSEPTPV